MGMASAPKWLKCLRSTVKPAVIALTALLSIFAAVFVIHQVVLPTLASLFPTLDLSIFDLGVYGAYPAEQYATFDLAGPNGRRPKWDPVCDQGLILMTPNGPSVPNPGPMILDPRGELVWISNDFRTTANLKVQHYRGQDFLTFWSGEKAATSGKGVYVMLDSTYHVVYNISAAGHALFGDLHEFDITKQGTALITVYNTTNADLTAMGMARGRDGWIVDSLFQEIDIETGALLFQWSAAQHFDPVDTYMTNPFGGYQESLPFDFYHLNSVDKDSHGNYLISSRHFHHIVCISPEGETLWILGGRYNQFRDLSNGQATNFKWQHDARWISEEEGILSLFDNSRAGPLHSDATESRALVIRLHVEKKTAELVSSMTSLEGILSSSQGSVQVLPESNNFFVGWGSAAAYSEYSQDGQLLCETHLGASWLYLFERMKSYRTTKTSTWRGIPKESPQVELQGDILSVSWNGATEVAFWALEATEEQHFEPFDDEQTNSTAITFLHGSNGDGKSYDLLDIIPKTGFEGYFDLSQIPSTKSYKQFRAVALDAQQNMLRYSEPCEPASAEESSYLGVLFKLCLVLGCLTGLRLAFKRFRAAGRLRNWSTGQSKRLFPSVSAPAWMNRRAAHDIESETRAGVYAWMRIQWSSSQFRPR